jgi:mono/diheme cytochrome c family protein
MMVAGALALSGGCGTKGDAGPLDAAGDGSVDPILDGGAQQDGSIPATGPVDCTKDLDKDGLYTHLKCAILYTDIAQKAVSPRAMPYVPGLPFWSDGAEKQRWLVMPDNTQIDTTDIDAWIWPVGTSAWKEFKLDGKRIETRVYQKRTNDWTFATYRWLPDESDALKMTGGAQLSRGAGNQPYVIPSINDCAMCHDGQKDKLLGLEAVNLATPGAQGLTLANLVAMGKLTKVPPQTTVAFPEDATGKAAEALGWLHVNCGVCHNPHAAAGGQSHLYLLTQPSLLFVGDGGTLPPVTSLPAWTTTVNQLSDIALPAVGTGNYVFIKPGSPTLSLVSVDSGRRVPPDQTPSDRSQMPPLVSRLVDTVGHQKLDDWISALP